MCAQERSTLLSMTEKLFSIFDRDGNGVVDRGELAVGISILCPGSQEDKIKAAFDLYDENGDGVISLEVGGGGPVCARACA
jgi:Ca2+-binding EF-hand superfamily protein